MHSPTHRQPSYSMYRRYGARPLVSSCPYHLCAPRTRRLPWRVILYRRPAVHRHTRKTIGIATPPTDPPIAPATNPSLCDDFLRDVRRNLTGVRKLFGARSPRYRRLVRQYRAAATDLGCRRVLERVLHRLRRRHGVTLSRAAARVE